MGLCGSVPYAEKLNELLTAQRADYDRLGLKIETTHAIWGVFVEMWKKNPKPSWCLPVADVLDFFGLQLHHPFYAALSCMLNVTRTGDVSFMDFLDFCWSYLPFTRMNVFFLAFDLLDPADSKLCDFVRLLCEKTSDDTRHAARSMLASVRRATDLAEDDDITDPVSFAQFLKLTKQHPFLLSPALELAGMMRDKVCGSDWWQRLSLERGSAVFLRHAQDYYHHVRGDMNLGQGKPTVAFARVKTPAEKALMEKLVFRDELVEVDVVFRSSATAQALFDVLSIGESVIARRQAARELSSLARGKGSSRDSHRDSIGSSKARVAPTMKIVADDSGAGAGGVARAPPARDARGSSRKIAPSGDKASGHGLRIRAPKP